MCCEPYALNAPQKPRKEDIAECFSYEGTCIYVQCIGRVCPQPIRLLHLRSFGVVGPERAGGQASEHHIS